MINLAASRPEREISPTRVCTTECHGNLPRAVVKVGVPRGPGAVEGKGQLLVVLVLLTPHPEGGEHFDLHITHTGQLLTRASLRYTTTCAHPIVRTALNSQPRALPSAVGRFSAARSPIGRCLLRLDVRAYGRFSDALRQSGALFCPATARAKLAPPTSTSRPCPARTLQRGAPPPKRMRNIREI